MNLRVPAVIVSVLFVISIIMGITSIFTIPLAQGFSSSDLHPPLSFTVPSLSTVPNSAGTSHTTPAMSINLSVGQVFADYGGSIRLTLHNKDMRQLFLIDIGFEWMDTFNDTVQEVHERIPVGESVDIRALSMPAHEETGEQPYRIKIRILEERPQGWYRILSGGDDWLHFGTPGEYKTIMVHSYSSPKPFDVQPNQYLYYQKANELLNFDSLSIERATEFATVGLGSTYNTGKACAIFDYVDSNIIYTDDPGDDLWYAPEVCLSNKAGDCEDYSLLIAAMIHEAGGTTRMYLTNDHAFAAIYAGNTSAAFTRIKQEVNDYYSNTAELHAMEDETGYWLIADPLGSFHLGGLAVGASPAPVGNDWDIVFEETDLLHSIDLTGEDAALPIWLNTHLWLMFVMIFGITDIAFLLVMAGEKETPRCRVCTRPAEKAHYKCDCGAGYHHTCLPSQGFCLGCGAPIEYPPPISPPGIQPGD